jgi:hypothetical protein
MEPVDVFGGIDGFKDALGVYVFREWELDEDAVDAIVAIKLVDKL